MQNRYGGVIWTNHALDRLRERGVKQDAALAAFNRPDSSRPGNNDKGSMVYYKVLGGERIEVVAKQNEKGEWIILSVWSRPIDGRYQKTSQGGILRWFWKFIVG